MSKYSTIWLEGERWNRPPTYANSPHHQYLRARLEDEFHDADEPTLADTLESLSDPPQMCTDHGDLYQWHGDDLVFDSHKRVRKFMQCSPTLSSLYSCFDHVLFQATRSLRTQEEADNA